VSQWLGFETLDTLNDPLAVFRSQAASSCCGDRLQFFHLCTAESHPHSPSALRSLGLLPHAQPAPEGTPFHGTLQISLHPHVFFALRPHHPTAPQGCRLSRACAPARAGAAYQGAALEDDAPLRDFFPKHYLIDPNGRAQEWKVPFHSSRFPQMNAPLPDL